MTTLYLIRHGETEWNREGRFQGWLDSALTERGRSHADANGLLLAKAGVDAIWASPLGRVRQTVAGIVEHVGTDVAFDDRLKECNVGAWEGQTIERVRADDPIGWQRRAEDLFRHRAPGGESLEDVEARVAPFLRSVLPLDGATTPDDHRIAIVSHGLMTRVILRVALAPDVVDVSTAATPNDGVYRIEWQPGVRGARPLVSHFLAGVGPKPGFIPRPQR